MTIRPPSYQGGLSVYCVEKDKNLFVFVCCIKMQSGEGEVAIEKNLSG